MLWPHVTDEKAETSQGKPPFPQGSVLVPAGLLPVTLFRPGHRSGTLWDFGTVAVALGLTKGRRDKQALEWRGSGSGREGS